VLFASGHGAPIDADAITVVDGDTIDVGPDRYRMVGYDTPEIKTPRREVSADERALAAIAKERFTELLRSGALRWISPKSPVLAGRHDRNQVVQWRKEVRRSPAQRQEYRRDADSRGIGRSLPMWRNQMPADA
jgi:hypothetical protein